MQQEAYHKNLEFKARCPDLDRARSAASAAGAARQGVLHQEDTYFATRSGRLKLRQITGDRSELIFYQRATDPDVRASRYTRLPVDDDATLKTMLAASLGILSVVRKRRELWLWHNVRIHLDEVENLGKFVELEAVITRPEDESASHHRLEQLIAALEIRADDRIASSYGELAQQQTA